MDRFFRKLDKKFDALINRIDSALDDAESILDGNFNRRRGRSTPPPPPPAPTPPPLPGSYQSNSYDDEDYDDEDYDEEEEYEDEEEYEEDYDEEDVEDEDEEEEDEEEEVRPVPPPIPNRRKPAAPQPAAPPQPAAATHTPSSTTSYLSPRMQGLIEAAVRDGVVTEAELAVLVRKGAEEGLDADELVMVVNARLYEVQQEMGTAKPKSMTTPPPLPRRTVPGKCPHCGAINPPGTAVCQECGKPLPGANRGTDISQLQGALKLQAILDALDKDYKRGRLTQRSKDLKRKIEIRNFPLPTDPKGLGDFLMLCIEQYWNPDGDIDETDVWEKRAAEGVRYAQTYHRGDRSLMEIAEDTRDQLGI